MQRRGGFAPFLKKKLKPVKDSELGVLHTGRPKNKKGFDNSRARGTQYRGRQQHLPWSTCRGEEEGEEEKGEVGVENGCTVARGGRNLLGESLVSSRRVYKI